MQARAVSFTTAFCCGRCLEYLLRNDANPGIRDNQGYNAVHYASAYGHRLCLELVKITFCFLSFQYFCVGVISHICAISPATPDPFYFFIFLQIASETPLDVVG